MLKRFQELSDHMKLVYAMRRNILPVRESDRQHIRDMVEAFSIVENAATMLCAGNIYMLDSEYILQVRGR